MVLHLVDHENIEARIIQFRKDFQLLTTNQTKFGSGRRIVGLQEPVDWLSRMSGFLEEPRPAANELSVADDHARRWRGVTDIGNSAVHGCLRSRSVWVWYQYLVAGS
jgi:hypothetical protein